MLVPHAPELELEVVFAVVGAEVFKPAVVAEVVVACTEVDAFWMDGTDGTKELKFTPLK
jgi:hypothetical protein